MRSDNKSSSDCTTLNVVVTNIQNSLKKVQQNVILLSKHEINAKDIQLLLLLLLVKKSCGLSSYIKEECVHCFSREFYCLDKIAIQLDISLRQVKYQTTIYKVLNFRSIELKSENFYYEQ